MQIDFTCPAEVIRYTLPTKERPVCGLMLFNLSDRMISSVEVTLKLLSAKGEEKERLVFRARALNGRPRTAFQMPVPCTPTSADKAEASIDKVWFDDKAVWRRNNSELREYTPNDIPPSRSLTSLKYVAGQSAVGFPSQQDGIWVCVCGRPNTDSDTLCARCARSRDFVFSRFNREAVEKLISQKEHQLDLKTRSVREDAARIQRLREEEYNISRKKRRRRIRTAWTLVITLAVCCLIFFFGIPALRLLSARQNIAAGRYAEARITLAEYAGNPEVSKLIDECRYLQAKQDAQTNDIRLLETAAQTLRDITDRPDAPGLADQADYRRACLLLEQDKPREAAAVFDALGDYPGCDEKRKECDYRIAQQLMKQKSYTAAHDAFEALGAYRDSEDLAEKCIYIPAKELLDGGSYDAAITELQKIPGYQDSGRLIQKCHYLKGKQLLENDKPAEAMEEFGSAGDYEDAETLLNSIAAELADAAFETKDYRSAMTLYALLPEQTERYQESVYQLALQCLSDMEYLTARNLLGQLPEDYKKTANLKIEAALRAGLAAYKRGDYASAVELLTEARSVEDVDETLNDARIALAAEKLESGELGEAEKLLDGLPEEDAVIMLRNAVKYRKAADEEKRGSADLPALAETFASLGDYQDAPQRAAAIYYQLGADSAEASPLKAARYFAKASGYKDADEQAEKLYSSVYSEPAERIAEAIGQKDFRKALKEFDGVDMSELPDSYAFLNDEYRRVNYEIGTELLDDQKPYEAKPYLQAAQGYRDADKKLDGNCYRIIGKWNDKDGNPIAVFNEDGTCEINGEKLFFAVSGPYSLLTAETADGEKKPTHRISDISDTRLTLRDQREGKEKLWYLDRAGDD